MHKTDKAVSPKDVSVYIFTEIMNIILVGARHGKQEQCRVNIDATLIRR